MCKWVSHVNCRPVPPAPRRRRLKSGGAVMWWGASGRATAAGDGVLELGQGSARPFAQPDPQMCCERAMPRSAHPQRLAGSVQLTTCQQQR